MNITLKSKNILVTGASGGIGRAIALGCGKSGARIAVHYHKNRSAAERLAKKIGNRAQTFQADLAYPRSCEKLFHDVITAFGRLDVLVNNAGVFIKSPLAGTTWVSDWDTTMAVNLRAAGILTKLAVSHFRKRPAGGRIFNIASRAAFRGDDEDYCAYAASKAGMVALSRSIARAFGKDNITCFVIAPGWVKTAMAKESIKIFGEKRIIAEQALRHRHLTKPSDIAPLVVLLASGLADHATGTTIDVNGGSYVH
jgi:3-oxoacyl-[acyl-carrier protein] reductase